MKKLRNIIFTMLLLVVFFIPTKSYGRMVNVKVPKFNVTLNGVKMDNAYRRYPLITYNDITYLPMTYYDARLLELETLWDNYKRQLTIFRTEGHINYVEDRIESRNKDSYYAITPSFKIMVNNKYIDNNREEYPLLLFRDITYFPLTWRFAINEFGFYSYHFDHERGLVINSRDPARSNVPNYPVIIPKDKVENLDTSIEYRNMNHIVRIQISKTPFVGNLKVSRDIGRTFSDFGSSNIAYGYKARELGSSKIERDDYFNVSDGYVILYGTKLDGSESGLYRIDIMTGKSERMW